MFGGIGIGGGARTRWGESRVVGGKEFDVVENCFTETCACEDGGEQGGADVLGLGVGGHKKLVDEGDMVVREGGVIVVRQIKVKGRAELTDGDVKHGESVMFNERPYSCCEAGGGACVCCLE